MADSKHSSDRYGDEATAAGGAMLLREAVIELEPGAVLAGRYQIRRLVGKGATGVVLEADDRVSRSLVALKVFKPEIATDERWQEIVGSELRHARLLQHPNVCRVFDAGESGSYRFLTMEYANGGSLRQRLREGTADRAMEERISDARAVIGGLAAIHAAGIIHRDVKPDNVLRMEDGRLVVTDFGLAVAPGQTTFVSGYSGAVGTPSYMAPEVALGGDASMASDVFSLGVILHEIFFDRRPDWQTTKRGRFLVAPVDRASPRLARAMARLCAQCLDELGPRRPANAEEVRRRFERAVLGRTGSLLEAVRTSKWGLLAGLIGASAATAGVFYALQPGDGTVKAEITGTAVDWRPTARLIARKEGRLRCIYPGPDGRTVRVIWGKNPQVAETVDLASGAAAPWKLRPELVARGCPQWSPDSGAVAFLGGPSYGDIMMSANRDGSDARRLTAGYGPRWLPGGRELVFGFGRRRVGMTDLSGLPQILPEAPAAASATDDMLVGLAVGPRVGRVAALYGQQVTERSAVLTYRFPSWEIESRIEVPANVTRVFFTGDSDELSIIAEEGGSHAFMVSGRGGDFVRKGRLAGSELIDVLAMPSGPVAVTHQRSVTAIERSRDGQERVLLVAPDLGRLSVTATADGAVMERLLEDGRWIIARYEQQSGRISRLTEGPHDRDPLLMPGGKEFLFIQGTKDRRVRACSVGAPSSCRTVFDDSSAYVLLGVSPSGRKVAYAWMSALQLRVRVVSATGHVTDLGIATTICRLRWPSEDRFWMFERSPSPMGWVEMNVADGTLTGRRQPEDVLGSDRCPEPRVAAEGPGLRFEPRTETSLYQLPGVD